MSNLKVKTGKQSISFGGLLAIAFIVLKLCTVISWSWWWVLSPLWIPVAFWLSIVIIVLVILIFKE